MLSAERLRLGDERGWATRRGRLGLREGLWGALAYAARTPPVAFTLALIVFVHIAFTTMHWSVRTACGSTG